MGDQIAWDQSQDLSQRGLMRMRGNHRAMDIAESQTLLLELGSSEPTLQQCFKVIESTCLSQGITCQINGVDCSRKFQKHLDLHYIPFLKESVRAMIIYGFVPWRLRRLQSGDSVPEVLPAGTFDWHTELGPTQRRDARYGYFGQGKRKQPTGRDDDTRLVVYRVQPTSGDVREEDVNVYMYALPGLNVAANSMLSATVPSPLAHILTEYKNMRNAQIRRSYADAWNTTAHIISTFRPNVQASDDPNKYLMDFQDAAEFAQPLFGRSVYPSLHAHNWFERDMLIRRQLERPSTHRPQVYTLPRDHEVIPQAMLTPCEDLPFLRNKFQRDLTAVTGVPFEMVIGREGGSADTVKKTMTSGRLFSTNMHEYCRHMQYILTDVYCRVYKAPTDSVEFTLTPMPRLEVESVADFKILFDIGALTPDMSLELSQVLLGRAARPYAKVRPGQGGGGWGEGGDGSAQVEGEEGSKADSKRQKDQRKEKGGLVLGGKGGSKESKGGSREDDKPEK